MYFQKKECRSDSPIFMFLFLYLLTSNSGPSKSMSSLLRILTLTMLVTGLITFYGISNGSTKIKSSASEVKDKTLPVQISGPFLAGNRSVNLEFDSNFTQAEKDLRLWLNQYRRKTCNSSKLFQEAGKVYFGTIGSKFYFLQVVYGNETFFAKLSPYLTINATEISLRFRIEESVPSPCNAGKRDRLANTLPGSTIVHT